MVDLRQYLADKDTTIYKAIVNAFPNAVDY